MKDPNGSNSFYFWYNLLLFISYFKRFCLCQEHVLKVVLKLVLLGGPANWIIWNIEKPHIVDKKQQVGGIKKKRFAWGYPTLKGAFTLRVLNELPCLSAVVVFRLHSRWSCFLNCIIRSQILSSVQKRFLCFYIRMKTVYNLCLSLSITRRIRRVFLYLLWIRNFFKKFFLPVIKEA